MSSPTGRTVHGLNRPSIGGTSKSFSYLRYSLVLKIFSQIPGLRSKSGKKTLTRQQPKNPGLTPAQRITTQLAKRLEASKTAAAEDHEDEDERGQEFPLQVEHDYNHWGENWIDAITNDDRYEDEGHTSSSTEPESVDEQEHRKWEARERARDAHRQLEGQQGGTSSTEPELVEEEDEHRKAWEALQAEIAKWRQKQKHMKEAEHQEEEARREVEWHQEQSCLQERHQKEMEHQKEEAHREEEAHKIGDALIQHMLCKQESGLAEILSHLPQYIFCRLKNQKMRRNMFPFNPQVLYFKNSYTAILGSKSRPGLDLDQT